MSYSEGSMSTEQLKKLFGDSLQVRDDGHVTFSNDGDADKFMNNSKLRDVFTGAMGRSESDWDDGHKSTNDLGAVVRYLSDGGDKPEEAPEKDVELSPRLATARARALQYEEDRVSGQAMKDLYDSENNPAEGFMERYKSKLGDQLKNGMYRDASNNSSTVASGANDVSIDVSKFARLGIDERKDY